MAVTRVQIPSGTPFFSLSYRLSLRQGRRQRDQFVTKVARLGLLGERQNRIKAVDRLPDLGAGNPRVPLRHSQIPVPQLGGNHIQFNSLLAKPSRESGKGALTRASRTDPTRSRMAYRIPATDQASTKRNV